MFDFSKPVSFQELLDAMLKNQMANVPPPTQQQGQPQGQQSVWGMMHPDAAPGSQPTSLFGKVGGQSKGGAKTP